jgi:DNA-binding transcriptional MerR regulator
MNTHVIYATEPGNGHSNGTARPKTLYKAGELSRRTGMTRQALHQYVLMGLLEPDSTTKGGQRLFSEGAEQRVKLIRDLCDQGYTLKDVKDIFIQQ